MYRTQREYYHYDLTFEICSGRGVGVGGKGGWHLRNLGTVFFSLWPTFVFLSVGRYINHVIDVVGQWLLEDAEQISNGSRWNINMSERDFWFERLLCSIYNPLQLVSHQSLIFIDLWETRKALIRVIQAGVEGDDGGGDGLRSTFWPIAISSSLQWLGWSKQE